MNEEEFLLFQISEIQKRYQEAIDPYVKRLVAIHAMKPIPPMMIDIADIEIWRKLSRTNGVPTDE